MKNTQLNSNNDFIAPPCSDEIEIIYQDQYLLVIDKPSGLLSLSGKNPLNKDSVHHRLVKIYPNPAMVHRLDFGTSGLMVIALNKDVNAQITKQFQLRLISKTYEATLFGELSSNEGDIRLPIARADFPYQKVCSHKGKPAHSHFKVLDRFQDVVTGVKTTRVLFTPTTGRTHQLRVHSQAIGHPILGCDLYSLSADGLNSKLLAPRLMLHANTLSFEHPVTGKRIMNKSKAT